MAKIWNGILLVTECSNHSSSVYFPDHHRIQSPTSGPFEWVHSHLCSHTSRREANQWIQWVYFV